MTTRIVIVRHGNTFAAGQTPTRVGARTDLPLVDSGRDQAFCLGESLKNAGLSPIHIYTSTLQRTIVTAQLCCQTMMCSAPHEQLPFLNEIDYGPDENKPEGEVIERIGEAAIKDWDTKGVMPAAWLPNPAVIVSAWQSFLNKVQTDFKNKTIMVVTSNGIARFALGCTVNGQDFPLKLSTGAYGVLTADDVGLWHVTEWNTRP